MISMKVNKMINLQKDFFDKVSEKDFSAIDNLFENESVFLFPGVSPMHGIRRIKFLLKGIGDRFSEISWIVNKQFVSDDMKKIIIEWDVKGLYKTGKLYNNSGCSIITLGENNKIKIFNDFFKSTDFSD